MKLNEDWSEILKETIQSDWYQSFRETVDAEYELHNICPPQEKVFAAFNLCPYKDVKVVILGQDPYFNPGQAVGLSFSVELFGADKAKVAFPPSLKNIIKEVRADLGSCAVEDGDLRPWARQGVLLLNTCLTVRQGQPLSHAGIGWDKFTLAVINVLAQKKDIVFVLWGSHARAYKKYLVTNPRNEILEAAHPSPLSAHSGFFGCGHFQKINEFLVKHGKAPIVF